MSGIKLPKIRPSKKVKSPTFVSYVGDSNGQVSEQIEDNKSLGGLSIDDDARSRNSVAFEGLLIPDNMFQSLEPSYLPGEMLISKADRVMRYIPYSDCRQGVIGAMFVTNFRILFMPVKRTSGMELSSPVWKNMLYSEDDIILNNIDAAYQVSRRSRKKLVAGKQSDKLKKIEIHCKDMRIHQFNMENAAKEEASSVTNAIAHFSFVDKLDRLFAFSYKGDTSVHTGGIAPVPDFTGLSGWEAELNRLNVKAYRVADCNDNFTSSYNMPKYFVVPSTFTNELIRKAFKTYEDYRCPVWSYTHFSGASLIRMTFPVSLCTDPEEMEKSVLDTVRQSHPEHKRPIVYDIHDSFPAFSVSEVDENRPKLPGIKEIKNSFDKLREICMPVTIKELESSDNSWYNSLDSTKWLIHISTCLKVALKITEIMAGNSTDVAKKFRRSTFIVKEHDGARDLAPLVTSLVQLIMDPHARTFEGFQTLIEREWVALSHRFKDRCGLICQTDYEEKQSPVFLMFLDCVWQMLQQQPSAFQFSAIYLSALWDSLCSGLFANFLFNSQYEMASELSQQVSDARFSRLGDKQLTHSLLNVWDWTKQYSSEDLSLFNSPSYITRQTLHGRKHPTKEAVKSGNDVRRIRVLSKYYKEKPSASYIDLELEFEQNSGADVLSPNADLSCLGFWSECYLRWLTPIQVVGGGLSMEYILEALLAEETLLLHGRIQELTQLKEQLKGNSSPDGHDGSDNLSQDMLTVEHNGARYSPMFLKRQPLDNCTSSFPYTPIRPTTQVSFFGTPIKMGADELTASSELESSIISVDVP